LLGLELNAIEDEMSEFRTLWRTWLMVILLISLLAVSWGLRKFRNMP
jgi:hypothetical protein